MINSDDLRFFSVVATSNSLSAASRFLDITPPSVTQRLQNIEAKLGVRLIHRPSRQVRLTEEGEILFKNAQKIIAEIDALQETIDIKKGKVTGVLRVLAPLGFGTEYIAPLLAEFTARYPELSADLTLSDNPNWMQTEKWDVVIYIGHLRDTSLYCTKIADNRRYLCASPLYLSQVGALSHPNELKNHSCLVLRENSEDVTRWKFTSKEGEILVRISPRLASNDGRAIKRWALDGMGIMVRSEWDVSSALKNGTLISLLEEFSLPEANIVALTGQREKTGPLALKNLLII
ncbi:LysR family transcriptional regulator [Mangrovibacter sp. SLW1]